MSRNHLTNTGTATATTLRLRLHSVAARAVRRWAKKTEFARLLLSKPQSAQQMKYVALALGFATSVVWGEMADAFLNIPELTGEVGAALWKSHQKYTIVTYQDDEDGPIETEVQSAAGWYLYLRQVRGVTDLQRKDISKKFARSEGFSQVIVAAWDRKPIGMLIWVAGPKTMELRAGTRVRLEECSFRINPLGLGMKCAKFEIVAAEDPNSSATNQPNKASLSTPAPPPVQSAMTIQPSIHSRSLAPGQV